MATTIGKLAVLVNANTAGLTSGLNHGLKALSNFAASAASVATGMIAADVIMGGARSIVNFATSAFSAADAAGDLADRLGVGVAELTALQHAANMTDTDVESLTNGLEKFVKHLGETGRDTNDLLGAFGDVADQVSKANGIVEEGQIVFDNFGKGALKLLPLLRLGRTGIAEMAKEAKELGVSFSEVDVSKIGAADNAIKRMKASVQGLGVSIASGFAPIIEMVAKLGTNVMKSIRPFVEAIADQLEPAISSLSTMMKDFNATDLLNFVEPLAMSVASFADGLINAGKRIGADFFGPLLKDMAEFADAFGPGMAEILTDALKPINDVFADLKSLSDWAKFAFRASPLGAIGAAMQQGRADMASAAAERALEGNKPTEVGNRMRELARQMEGVGPQSALVDGLSGLFDSVRARISGWRPGDIMGPFPEKSLGTLGLDLTPSGLIDSSMREVDSGKIGGELGSALIRGSAEEIAARNKALFGDQGKNPADKMVKKQEEGNRLAMKLVDINEHVLNVLENVIVVSI